MMHARSAPIERQDLAHQSYLIYARILKNNLVVKFLLTFLLTVIMKRTKYRTAQ